MPADVKGQDSFVAFLHTRAVETSPERVVVEQPDYEPLGNHVGVRHASALYAAGYEAGRALVLAALGDRADDVQVELTESETAYTFVGMGPLEFVAEPDGEGWDTAGEAEAQLRTKVAGKDQNGKTVCTLGATWTIRP